MADRTGLELVRGLYDYHWGANRRLADQAVTLGEDACGRDPGPHCSFPTIRRLLAHISVADWVWLAQRGGASPPTLAGAECAGRAELRRRWGALKREQRALLWALGLTDLGRLVEYGATDGRPYRLRLGPLPRHVANHATHRRSEVATMYHDVRTGQLSP